MNPDGKSQELNASQQRAVDYTSGHLLIVAGPGTGKTHTLTYRIARISRQLKSGQQLLAITFTHKAAEELKERLIKYFPDVGKKVFVGTFHSFCLSYLRDHIQDTDLSKELNIATTHDLERLAGELWPDVPKRQIKKKLHAVIEHKTRGSGEESSDEVAAYNAILKANALLDYDDLLLEAGKLLSSRRPGGSSPRAERLPAGGTSGLREKPTGRVQKSEFTHVFVDEYQDINALQHALLKEFVRLGAILTAIGDPQQAIYSFRGADVSFFERFTEDFKGAMILSLLDNYRSAPNLLKASGQIVARETPLISAVTADIYQQGRLTVYEAPTDKAEAEYVVHQIEKMVGGTSMFSQDSGRVSSTALAQRSFKDIAVLYRLNAQKNVLEEALARHGIPFQASDDRPFVELTPIPELVALLKDFRDSSTLSDAMAKLPHTAAGEKIFKDNRPAWRRNVERFVRMAKRFDHAEEFFDYLALQQPEDAIERRAENVNLLTLHAAKGLEFPVVFIVGCEQNLLPLSIENMVSDPAEERRLFYVGMTRAKETLFLTHARRRRLFGQWMSNPSSPYLDDIEHQLKEHDQVRSPRRPKNQGRPQQMELFPAQ